MSYLKYTDLGKAVLFIDNNGILRKGTVDTFPFNNVVDIKEEETGAIFCNISAKYIKN
ncbi:hypothetical protein [Priestia megaterium]|uniref:hypothetical protein n=1 Tax=Priestia megaterium TaxID=1404 RepID=UPI002877E157|nr:hypothetical protein [Priestia megaterium]